MRLFHRPVIYVQVYLDHFLARVVDGEKTIRRDCPSLDNRRGELKDFKRVREVLRNLFRELAPGFSFRRPVALMHFMPEHYVPTQSELANFKRTAERAGVSFCWLSTWEMPHLDKDLRTIPL